MWQKIARYLDYNAGAGLSPRVKKKITELLVSDDFFLANPSSRHRAGQKIQQALFLASEKVAKSLGVQSDDLLFVSSGTEANQSVIRSHTGFGSRSNLLAETAILIGAGEHSASYDLLTEFRAKNAMNVFELSLLPSGQYDLQNLHSHLAAASERGLKKAFLSLFWANNETGVMTNLVELKKVLDSSPIPVSLHLDGAQAWGKIPTDLKNTPANYVTFSAHKIGAPAGNGVIWMKPHSEFHPLLPGNQGRGRRGGTENALGILAMGEAAEEINATAFIEHTLKLRTAFESALKASGVAVKIWGEDVSRISNTSRFSFLESSPEGGHQKKPYDNWVELLDLAGFSVSHGSACKAQVIEPSRVLLKMGASPVQALNSLRISFGPGNTLEDATECARAIQQIAERKSNLS
jgi:cysteine desulfurase